MNIIEPACILTAAIYLFRMACPKNRPGVFWGRILGIMVASWIMEESAIQIFSFYSYHNQWCFRLGNVPVLVVFTWPILICSAHELVLQVSLSTPLFVPLWSALIVLSDALFIEPIAVHAGFWSWKHSGIFGVPLVGFAGWFFFAFFCSLFLCNRNESDFGASDLLHLILIIVGTHTLLILSWQLVLERLVFQFSVFAIILIVWSFSVIISYGLLRKKTGSLIRGKTLLLRLPAAAFFWVFLFFNPNDLLFLLVYISAFTPPYLVLLFQSYANQLSARLKFTSLSKSYHWDAW